MIFQVGTRCVNATYTANPDGTIEVLNQAVNRLNEYTSIRGTARVKDTAKPAALVVEFDNPS
jgi:lipocalin